MSLSIETRSDPNLLQKPSAEGPGSTTSRSPHNIKLTKAILKSPISNKSDRQLFNSQFSHLPAGAVVMFPPKLKEKEGCINYFAKNVMDRVDRSVPGRRDAYDTIKKTMDHEEVQRVVETSKRIQINQLISNRKKGSMYLSEFWTKKQTLNIIKASDLNKAYKEAKEIEREGLPARLKKLENLYDRRKDINGNLEMMDIGKIMQDFENQGINAPSLRFHGKSPVAVRTETSILDTEEDLNPITERVKKLGPSLLEIPSSVYDGNTIDTLTARSKSRSNVSLAVSKVKSMSKLVLPKISGTLTDLAESIPDLETNRNLFSNSIGYSRMDTISSGQAITIEEAPDLFNCYTEPSAREMSRGTSDKIFGLKTIGEIAKGGKGNKQCRETASTKNTLTARSFKSYDSNALKQKIELSRAKPIQVNQRKNEMGTRGKARDYQKGRKAVWVVPRKCDNLGQL